MKCKFPTKNKNHILLFLLVFILVLSSCKGVDGLTNKERKEIIYDETSQIIYEDKKLKLDKTYFEKSGSNGNISEINNLAILYGSENYLDKDEDSLLKEVLGNFGYWNSSKYLLKPKYELIEESDKNIKVYKVYQKDNEMIMKMTSWGDQNQHYLSVMGVDREMVNEKFDEIIN